MFVSRCSVAQAWSSSSEGACKALPVPVRFAVHASYCHYCSSIVFLECSLVFTLCYARSQQSALTDSVHTSPHSIYKCFSRSSRQIEVRRARDKRLCLSGWLGVLCIVGLVRWQAYTLRDSLVIVRESGGTFSSIDPRPNFICYSCQEVNCQAVQKAC